MKAKPKSKKEYIKIIGETSFIIAVKEIAEKGKANEAIIKMLATFLDIPASSIVLISGQASKHKIFEVPLTLQELDKVIDKSGQIKLFE